MTYSRELADLAVRLKTDADKARFKGLRGLEQSLRQAAASASSWSDALAADSEPSGGDAA